jgi:hypothetical protein
MATYVFSLLALAPLLHPQRESEPPENAFQIEAGISRASYETGKVESNSL